MDQQESVLVIPVVWRGKKLMVEINSGARLKEFGDELRKLADVKPDTLKLIVPQSSDKVSGLLSPFSHEHAHLRLQETSIPEVKSIRMMGVYEGEVSKVLQGEKSDLRIIGFEEEDRRMKQRMSYMPLTSLKLPDGPYIFCDFQTFELPGIQLNPPPSEALRRMHRLAADPGIVAIMKKHRWRVGIMTELAPVGYVGVSPKCLLGFNKNQGEEISLRLRTDDLKGFRKYDSIKKTLLHELAHMIYTEHDANFYALDKQLNQEAASLDWTRSRGHSLSSVTSSDHYDVDREFESQSPLAHKLGGSSSVAASSAREASVAAAYDRFTLASDTEKEEKEPEPIQIKNYSTGTGEKAKILANEVYGFNREPDLDCHSHVRTVLEPDPDDSGGESMKAEPYSCTMSVTKVEPGHDDTVIDSDKQNADISEILHFEAANEEQYAYSKDKGTCNDLDTDDSLTKMKCLPAHGHSSVKNEDERCEVEMVMEQEDTHERKIVKAEPVEISCVKTYEPDPDDHDELQRIQDPVTDFCDRLNKSIKTLHSEVDPSVISMVLQTLSKIIRNLLEHSNEVKYRRLRKGNPSFQRSVAGYKAAMEILFLIGFSEDTVLDEAGVTETYIVLKRDDPGLLWLANSILEACMA